MTTSKLEKQLEKEFGWIDNLKGRIDAKDEELIMDYLKSKERLDKESNDDFWYRKYKAVKELAHFYYDLNQNSSAEFWIEKLQRMGGSICPYCKVPVSLIEVICTTCFTERQGSS